MKGKYTITTLNRHKLTFPTSLLNMLREPERVIVIAK